MMVGDENWDSPRARGAEGVDIKGAQPTRGQVSVHLNSGVDLLDATTIERIYTLTSHRQ